MVWLSKWQLDLECCKINPFQKKNNQSSFTSLVYWHLFDGGNSTSLDFFILVDEWIKDINSNSEITFKCTYRYKC